ncbi:ubiquitin-protein ligase E3A [Macrosteles quadrilineatus]|uniref:ubiquitin-protein ligase E3A n=1 Tax=Macrosteles quadrilineatus TaxID=74068 RepID=UPI0023E29FEA|nr:ubiquitin-protein ligase E3A [Macrosteles quadrilineatus]
MTSKDEDLEFGNGEGSGGGSSSVLAWEPKDNMKRAAAKKLIERYFYQLTDGCGNSTCNNEHCASSGKVKGLSPNQAAAQAIQLFREDARLCETLPPKVPRTHDAPFPRTHCNDCVKPHPSPHVKLPQPGKSTLDEAQLLRVLETCQAENNYALLIRTLGEVYSSPESLGRSFLKGETSPLDAFAPSQLAAMRKEEVRELEGETEKDQDSVAMERGEVESCSDKINIDLASLRRAYQQLFSLSGNLYENALVQALVTLSENMELDLKMSGCGRSMEDGGGCPLETVLNALIIALEIPTLGGSDYLELALPRLCKAAALLPIPAQARLARIWARHCPDRLKNLLEALQQLITLRVITGLGASRFTRDYCVQDEDTITAPTKLMKIIYYANLLAGELEPPDTTIEEEIPDDDYLTLHKSPRQPQAQDPLSQELKVNVLESRKPFLPFSEFYNEPLSDAVEMDKDFANYKSSEGDSSTSPNSKFSFMRYSFILTPATKTLGLYYDNRIRMFSERRMSFFQTVTGQPTNPYLRLKVRRDHIIDDALVELEVVAMENPKDLKKQLVIEFEGEQGIDEGGVSKEFFQLIVEEIFNPDYGMFTFQEESQTVWFNTTSFESDAQYTLIGIVLGLAIYNNIILDVHFPMVVYRKLMGKRGTYHDLEDWNRTLHSGLQDMLNYEGDDLESIFMQTFRVCYTDIFGSVLHHDLKPNGDSVFVTQDNKKEFVDLYADFLLNTSVERQFRAFRRGFQMVTDESPLSLLFRPEEVEQLVCGSKRFDLAELEEVAEYDGGYTSDSLVVRWFWQIVHTLTPEDQRKLLQFATGSDRVPVGGLSKLKLIIARNGPDSDRLPTAHTCFNVLLLPEYESKEKLSDRLIKAISYSKGFGML